MSSGSLFRIADRIDFEGKAIARSCGIRKAFRQTCADLLNPRLSNSGQYNSKETAPQEVNGVLLAQLSRQSLCSITQCGHPQVVLGESGVQLDGSNQYGK